MKRQDLPPTISLCRVAYGYQKGLTIGTGQCNVKKYNRYLRDMIISGRADPSFVVSHEIGIDEAPQAYKKFDQRIEGYTKVLYVLPKSLLPADISQLHSGSLKKLYPPNRFSHSFRRVMLTPIFLTEYILMDSKTERKGTTTRK